MTAVVMSRKRERRPANRSAVTFELVNRSLEDPLATDKTAPQYVLVPVSKGEDVTDEDVERLARMMSDDRPAPAGKEEKKEKRGIGAEYNRYFVDGDMANDDVDYSRFFKAIDEGASDGVFIAPDGTVHDLKDPEIDNVDIIAGRHGFSAQLFGAELDPALPKLIDVSEDPMCGDMDLDLLLAMDDDDVEELDDDFVSKMLALEQEDDDDEDEAPAAKGGKSRGGGGAMSYVSAAPSHASRISHRSAAMDIVEERVEYLMNTVYNDEEEQPEEEDEGREVDWDDVIADFKKFKSPMHVDGPRVHALDGGRMPHIPGEAQSVPQPVGDVIVEEEEEEKEEPAPQKERERWDVESILDTLSTTENRPTVVRDENIVKRERKKAQPAPEPEEEELVCPPVEGPPGETKEEAKARKKAIKRYNQLRRQKKKETKQRFVTAKTRVGKSIAASCGARGQSVVPLS